MTIEDGGPEYVKRMTEWQKLVYERDQASARVGELEAKVKELESKLIGWYEQREARAKLKELEEWADELLQRDYPDPGSLVSIGLYFKWLYQHQERYRALRRKEGE